MKTVALKCNLVAACAYVLHPREETVQVHFYVRRKCETRKTCSLVLHGSRAGSEIKSFPWSSAPENSGRAELRDGGRAVQIMRNVGGIEINSLPVCLSSLFPCTYFTFLKSFLKLGRAVFRQRTNCCRGWEKRYHL